MAWTAWMFPLAAMAMAAGCGLSPGPLAPRRSAGDDVASALNARYADVRTACTEGTQAAFYCNGVLLRTTVYSPAYPFWNPNPADAYRGVSFSYFRADVGSLELFGTYGFIVAAAEHWSADGRYGLQMQCVYPYDAITGIDRGTYGCSASLDYPVDSRPCLEQGIVTADAFARHYLSVAPEPENPPDAFRRRALHQCAFGVDAFSFDLAVLARQRGRLEIPSRRYMEVMMAEWPQDIPDRLPIEALFFLDTDAGALQWVRTSRADFYEATGRLLPIVRIDPTDEIRPFSYHDDDQAL